LLLEARNHPNGRTTGYHRGHGGCVDEGNEVFLASDQLCASKRTTSFCNFEVDAGVAIETVLDTQQEWRVFSVDGEIEP
jgi:hypothetical protein